MDSNSQLDYALFQLTPTRARCDLVICVGDCKEKLASGLLQPFISHLKFANDEISKGGYSVTLSAPDPWFTKSTLERFVRFVSTSEVLERFITIEREIATIDTQKISPQPPVKARPEESNSRKKWNNLQTTSKAPVVSETFYLLAEGVKTLLLREKSYDCHVCCIQD